VKAQWCGIFAYNFMETLKEKLNRCFPEIKGNDIYDFILTEINKAREEGRHNGYQRGFDCGENGYPYINLPPSNGDFVSSSVCEHNTFPCFSSGACKLEPKNENT
jgi:hypothetical protein